MLIIRYTVETSVTPVQIWQIWQDVENWNSWDRDLESSHLNGPFQRGTTGILKFKNESELKTVLTHVEPHRIFIQEAKLFLAKAVMTHDIKIIDGKTYVTIQTDIQGPLSFFYFWLIGSSIKKKVPLEVEAMLKRAQNIFSKPS